MFELLTNFTALTKAKTDGLSAQTLASVGDIVGIAIDPAYAEMLAGVITAETDAIGTVGSWLKEPGNAQRALKILMGGEDHSITRCPYCQQSFFN